MAKGDTSHLARSVVVAAAVALLLCPSTHSLGADISFVEGKPEKPIELKSGVKIWSPESQPRIVIKGAIKAGDERRFAAALSVANSSRQDWNSSRSVWLDSLGGNVDTAMVIGQTIRDERLETLVKDGASCASACILILAGGVLRLAQEEGRLGVHRPFPADPTAAVAKGYSKFREDYSRVIGRYRSYFSRMGISEILLDRMAAIPSNQIVWVAHDYAREVNLLGDDPAHQEWKRAQRIASEGEACVQFSDRMFSCYNREGFNYARCVKVVGPHPPNCRVFGAP